MDEPLGGAAGGGLTAVHLAVKAGHMGVVGELVKAGAKPGITVSCQNSTCVLSCLP